MKKKFTFLIAALMLLTMIFQPTRLWGQSTTYTSNVTLPTSGTNVYSCSVSISSKTYSAVRLGKSNTTGNGSITVPAGTVKLYVHCAGWSNETGNLTLSTSASGVTITPTTMSLTADSGISGSGSIFTLNATNASTSYFQEFTLSGVTTSTTITMTSPNKKRCVVWGVNYVIGHTLTYSATNGSISGVDAGSNAVASGASIAEGATVTLTATPASGYTFSSWSDGGTNSTLSSTTTNPTTFTMGTSNVTVTATFVSAGNYINVSPTTATPTCAAQNVEFSIDTDQTLDANPVVFYTTSTGDVTTTKPAWIGDLTSAYSSTTLTIPVTANTGAARTAYFRVEKGSVQSDVITINQAVYAPSAPTLPAAGAFDYTKEITITVPSGTTVYYTLDGTNPTSGSTEYSAPFTIDATKTLKAVAYEGIYPSAIAEATYTRTYNYISDITSANNYTVKGTVVAVNGTSAFVLGDGTGYVYFYGSHSKSVGDLAIITDGHVKIYNHVFEFENGTLSDAASSTYTTGTPAITSWTESIFNSYSGSGVNNLSTYFQVVGTYTHSTKEISIDGTTKIVKLSTNTNYSSLNGKIVRVKGYFAGFNSSGTTPTTMYICPESVEAVPVITTTATSLTGFTYNVGSGPSTSQSFNVNASNLTDGITVALSATSSFEMSEDNSTFSTDDITISKGLGTVSNKTIYVRLKSGLSSGTYTPNITLSSDEADDVTVSLNGNVKHTIAISGSITNGSVESDPSDAAVAGATVTLTATPDANYKLGSFTVTKAGSGTVDVTSTGANTGTYTMPADNVTVSATFTPAYTVTYAANGGSGTMTDANSPYASGATVNVLDNSFTRTGYTFASWNTEDDGSGTTYYGASSGSTPKSFTITSNTILYAQWTINTHDITMPATNAYGSYAASKTTGVEYNAEVELTYTPAVGYEHYVAVWSVNGTPIVGNIFNMPDEAVTVTVETHATWTVTYNANGGSGSMSDPNSPYDNGANVTVLANGFTYLNHTFVKWNTRADGKGIDYLPGATISGISANVTLYAQWENGSHVTYTITSTSSVSTSGSAPIGSKAIFTQTYGTACQMTGGNSMTLTLKGYQAQTVKSIVLSMKSNKSAGAGTLAVVAGSTTLASIDNNGAGVAFSNSAWNGSYTQSYTDVTPAMTDDDYDIQAGEKLVITIAATTSSLFCESFTIYYETSDSPAVITSETEQTVTHASQSITTGDKIFNLYSLNIDSPTFELAYCDEDGTVLGSNPYSSWFTAAVTDNEKVTYSVTANSGKDRTAYFKVYATVAGDPVYSSLCSVTQKHQPYTYTLVDGSTVTLEAGKHYIITSGTSGTVCAMGYQKSSNRDAVSVSFTGAKINETEDVYEFVISGDNTNNWTIYDIANSKYLYASSSSSNNLNIQETNDANGQWAISISEGVASIVAQGTNSRKVMQFNSTLFSCYASASQSSVYLYKRDNDKDLEFYSPTTIASATIASDETYTVESGQTLNIETLTNSGSATNLIIEDGGQLITNSAVAATIKKNVASATSKDDPVYGWYTISSPLATTKIAGDGANTNLTTGTYDLLRYDEGSHTWENYKAGHGDFANMTAGRGYIYRNSGDVTVEYKGTVNNGKVDYAVTKDGDMLTGFNLIGNPYPHEIYKGAETAIPNSKTDDYELATGFYTLTKEGAWHSGTDNSTAILPGQGLLVQATTAGTISMTNTVSDGSAKANNDNIKFTVANNRYEDVTYAWFDKGIGLDKIDHRNPDVPMLYINMDDQNYAVATMSDDTKAFNLCFKAKKIGQYTLSYKAKGEFNYLHVIDCITGDDVDMLLEEKYVFMATPQDIASRFIVRLSYNTDGISDDDSFVYQNGSDIIVNGNGELQIFDVMGRMVSTRCVNGLEVICTSSLQTGVYIFRLAGNDIKTQKIIIK